MKCSICAALNREHSSECEAEASATIEQRSQVLLQPGVQDQLDQVVLGSRKRQAHITSKLHRHCADEHPEDEVSRAATA
jgi:hypothetical protein